jgi:L-ascorbate metabolism protein UlaG (beta-lactamase superfamily)
MEILQNLLVALKYLLYAAVVLSLLVWLFLNYAPAFGGKPDENSTQRMTHSKNFRGGKFVNLASTQVSTSSGSRKISIFDWVFTPDGKNPAKPLPSESFDRDSLTEGKFVWLGHSTLLMKTSGVVIMTDPVFNRASPVVLIGNPFSLQNPIAIDDLPTVDAVIISHDHYDHLDYQAITDLSERVDRFFVPLGVKAHLQRWGVNGERISELDWYESELYRGLKLTLAPARHFSGRRFSNRNETLWGSWVIDSKTLSAYFSGDGGYSETFKTIGEKYGPFDIAFMENGAYNLNWANIHMMPEQTVQASIDLNARVLFPIHWSKFDLSVHPWDEPAIRITAEAKRRDVTVATPLIGEVFDLEKLPQVHWWEALRTESDRLVISGNSQKVLQE